MSHHPDDQTQGEPPDPELEPGLESPVPADNEDFHPAIDPREPLEPIDGDPRPTAPPLDIDAREDALAAHQQPEVIELSGHIDDGQDDRHSNEGGDTVVPPADDAAPAEGTDSTPGDRLAAGSTVDATEALPIDSLAASTGAGDGADPEHAEPGGTDRGTTRPADSPTAAASSLFAGVAARLGLGRSSAPEKQADPADRGSVDPGRGRPNVQFTRTRSKVADGVRSYLDPRLHMFSTIPHRRVLAGGVVLVLLSLLANSGGLALIILSAIVPILIVITLTQHDVFEKESNLLVAAVAGGGAVVGIVLSLLSIWIHASQWFDDGVLNFGAAGFGGRFADAAGSAPFVVWFLVGLLLPAVAIAGIAGIPIAMRRWPQFRNEVMDGMILAGASAAGFSIGAAIVYWWPMIAEPGPQTNVSDWTLSIIGVAVLRSAVITLCGAMIGAGIWRYMVTPAASVVVLPAVGGVAGYLLLTFGSIQFQAAGNWPEFLWIAILLAAVFVLYRRVLDQAVATDRRTLGADQGRLVCPSCHKVTPAGAFCARCGKPLPQPDRGVGDAVEEPVEVVAQPGGQST